MPMKKKRIRFEIKALTQRRWFMPLFLLFSFTVSRLVFWSFGIRFDFSIIGWGWQFLDIRILQDQLLQGLLYLHAQPPLFNFFLGIVLKVCPHSVGICLHTVFFLLGFLLYTALYYYLRLEKFSRIWSVFLSFLFIVSPTCVLYESWFFYTYPVAVFLAVGATTLRKFESSLQLRWAWIFIGMVTAVCLIRSAFHLVFLLICIILPAIPLKRQVMRKFAVGALLITSIVIMLYLKNLVLFGFPGPSSWTGMNFFRAASHAVPRRIIKKLVSEDRISSIALIPPFSTLDEYPAEYSRDQDNLSVFALTQRYKGPEIPNFNNPAYIAISQDYLTAAKKLIRLYPQAYLYTVLDAWSIYCRPSWDYGLVENNAEAISPYIQFLFALREKRQITFHPRPFLIGKKRVIHIPLQDLIIFSLLLPLIAVLSLNKLWKMLKEKSPDGTAYLFMAFAVFYVAIIGNAVEWGENNRFRVMTDPLLYLLFLTTCRELWRGLQEKWKI